MQRKSIRINSNKGIILLVGCFISVISILVAIQLGSVDMSWKETLKSIFTLNRESLNSIIIWDIRLPRIILSFLVGGTLSAAGMALQTLLRNPLAEPYTIGVSSGATLAVAISIVVPIPFLANGSNGMNLLALIGAIIALFLVLFIANWGRKSLMTESIILAGIVLSAFFGAFITLLISLSKNSETQAILGWMMGSLNGATWADVYYVIPFVTCGFIYLLIRIKTLRALSEGDSAAQQVGIRISLEKTFLFIAIAVMTGAVVSVSGMIGFVGLIVPHFARRLIRGINWSTYILCFIVGGSYLVLADLIARTIIAPVELPIGVVTAIIGAPIFTWILVRARQGGHV